MDDKIYTYSGIGISIYDLSNERYQSKVYVKAKQEFVDEVKLGVVYQKLKPFVLNKRVYVHNQELSANNFKGIKAFSPKFRLESDFLFLSELEISAALELSEDSFVFATKTSLVFSSKTKISNEVTIEGITEKECVVKILKVPNENYNYLLLVKNENGEKRLLNFNSDTNIALDMDQLIDFNTTISDAIFDFEDNLWISTFGDGIYCYYYSNPKIQTVLEGSYIIDILKKDNSVYALTSSQLYEFKNDSLVSDLAIAGFAKKLSNIDGLITVSALNTKQKSNPKFNVVSGRYYGKTKDGFIRQGDTLFINQKQVLISNELFVR
ncbi:MAG: hypothetical protein NWP87_04100, partial [Winogradskyella sp.]|nr:hypothetical protein [Winogradskyella sp.]